MQRIFITTLVAKGFFTNLPANYKSSLLLAKNLSILLCILTSTTYYHTFNLCTHFDYFLSKTSIQEISSTNRQILKQYCLYKVRLYSWRIMIYTPKFRNFYNRWRFTILAKMRKILASKMQIINFYINTYTVIIFLFSLYE